MLVGSGVETLGGYWVDRGDLGGWVESVKNPVFGEYERAELLHLREEVVGLREENKRVKRVLSQAVADMSVLGMEKTHRKLWLNLMDGYLPEGCRSDVDRVGRV